MNPLALVAATALFSLLSVSAVAQTVEVKDAWARATVQGQKATGVFMKLTAKEDTRLVGVASSAAGVSEVHEMKMQGDVMQMRALDGLDLPAGKTMELKPGGYHVMLMDLKKPLEKGSTVDLTLLFKDGKGRQSKMDLKIALQTAAPTNEHKH